MAGRNGWEGVCVCVCMCVCVCVCGGGGVPFPLRFYSPSALTVLPRSWGKKDSLKYVFMS